jgi:hypothetical protein
MRLGFDSETLTGCGLEPSKSASANDIRLPRPSAGRPAQRLGSASCLKVGPGLPPGGPYEEAITVIRDQAEGQFRKGVWYPITAEGMCGLCNNTPGALVELVLRISMTRRANLSEPGR